MFKTYLPIILILGSSAQALVEKHIDKRHPLEVVFSTASHNRISIEDGGVEKIIGDSELFSISIDALTGNAFINVIDKIEKPTTLSIITYSGAVQDLSVHSSAGPSEQVLLHEVTSDEWAMRPGTSQACSVDLLNQLLAGNTPSGYDSRSWDDRDLLQVPEPLSSAPLRSIEGPFEIITVHEVTNLSKKPVSITPDQVKNKNSWVFLMAHELDGKEKAICITGRSKD
jgi:hypothetical protein